MKNNRSVERALSVLLFVCQSEVSLGLTEISRATELDKATTLRLLRTLSHADMVTYDASKRRYLRGPGVYNFWPSEMRNICRPHMLKLLDQINETICIIVSKGNKRVCIDAIEPDRMLRIVAPTGKELPVFVGASGRVLMAYKDDKQIQSILDDADLVSGRLDLGQNREKIDLKINKTEYLEQIQQVRDAGFLHISGDLAPDTSTLAAPIFDELGNAAAVLVVRAPSTRMHEGSIDEMVKLVKHAAQGISDQMANINT